MLTFCNWLGLDDDGVELSSEEFGEQWQKFMAKGNRIILFEHMFHIVDCNGDVLLVRNSRRPIILPCEYLLNMQNHHFVLWLYRWRWEGICQLPF